MSKLDLLEQMVHKYVDMANEAMFANNNKLAGKYDDIAFRLLEEMLQIRKEENAKSIK